MWERRDRNKGEVRIMRKRGKKEQKRKKGE